jgi:hypothetical protein
VGVANVKKISHTLRTFLYTVQPPLSINPGYAPAPCASRTTILKQVFTGHCTGTPPAIPLEPHSFRKAKTHTTASRPCCHTVVLTSFPLRAEQHHPIATIPTSHLPSGPTVPVHTASLTDMPSPLTAHGSTWWCSKVTACRRHDRRSPVIRSIGKARARNATPNRRQ